MSVPPAERERGSRVGGVRASARVRPLAVILPGFSAKTRVEFDDLFIRFRSYLS